MYYVGHSALSNFRHAKYIKLIRSIAPSVAEINVIHLYFIENSDPLTVDETTHLETLLHARALPLALDMPHLIIVPRLGTRPRAPVGVGHAAFNYRAKIGNNFPVVEQSH